MKRAIEEMQRYDCEAEEIIQLSARLQKENPADISGLKFADIALIYGEYLKFIESKFINPDTQLTEARKVLVETRFIKGARLWVDGFAGFTAQETAMLLELLKVVSDAKIALCLDPQKTGHQPPDEISLFNPTERTYTDLTGFIKKHGLRVCEPVCLEKRWRFISSPQLRHVEENLFESNRPTKRKQNESIRVVSASNARAEIRFAAREILNLVKKKNLRFRDIAVVTPNPGDYQHYIQALFGDYGIPFFIDMRRPLRGHPLIELILSAVRVVSFDFHSSDIFAFLKTGLTPMQQKDVDVLENYCVAFGIGREDWKRSADWQFADKTDNDFDEGRINRIRREAVGPLLEFEKNLSGEKEKITPEEFTEVIFSLLEKLGARERLSEWISEAIEVGDLEKAGEHRQCYDRVVDVFDELVGIFSGRMMTAGEYLSIIDGAFANLTLAFIPPRLEANPAS